MVYENNVLKLLQQGEGRVLPDGAGWEYQYFIKDHLGNVRVTFTAKTQTATIYTTNFEAATDANFQNYSNTTFDLVDHTDAATVHQKVQWLNGGVNGRVGLAKSLAVMPGDQVSMFFQMLGVEAMRQKHPHRRSSQTNLRREMQIENEQKRSEVHTSDSFTKIFKQIPCTEYLYFQLLW
ncbi:MAG TPA: hypothetical protein VK658_21330 [Chryseolinea sp.]|nr:hypothetical protein [Chryseolinea sp.]